MCMKRRFIGLHLRVMVTISCHIQVFRNRSFWKPAGITQCSLNWVCRYWVFCCIYAFAVYFSGLSHSPWSWLSLFILSVSLLSLCLWHRTGLVEGKTWKEIYLVPLMCRAFFFYRLWTKIVSVYSQTEEYMIAVPSLPVRAGFDIIHTL